MRPSRSWLVTGICASLALILSALWVLGSRDEASRSAKSPEHSPNGSRSPMTDPSGRSGPSQGGKGREAPEGQTITPFDTEYTAVARLDPRLLEAVQRAAEDARRDGVEFRITSGWRSKEHQRRLLDRAVERYGSLRKAREFVKPPEDSEHVSGKAVDIGPTDADDWLIRKGAAYGLCQAYANEMWHFELLTEPGGTCPAPRANAAG